jgi:hypothetical protein
MHSNYDIFIRNIIVKIFLHHPSVFRHTTQAEVAGEFGSGFACYAAVHLKQGLTCDNIHGHLFHDADGDLHSQGHA